MIVEYIDSQEPLTVFEVKLHCRVDHDSEDDFFENVIIPGARAMAEAKTGCAIRKAKYRDEFDDIGVAVLAVGGVTEILEVTAEGAAITAYESTIRAGRTTVYAEDYRGKPGTVTYQAGIDLALHSSVKNWLLLACGYLYSQRELLYAGQAMQEMPQRYVDSLLSSIDLHAAI